MNKIIALICCIALSKVALAQKDSLAFDDRGQYIYYKVVGMDKYNADVLYKRSLNFFDIISKDKTFKITEQNAKTTSITGTGILIVYKPSLAKHPDGQVAYTLKMEIKDAKYRYWLTDFVYTPYFRDRYNNYVPDKGISAAMEKPSKILNEKELNKYLDDAALFARQLGDKLKKYISTDGTVVSKKDTVAKKVIHIDKGF
jgi:hypothetical protein